MPHIEQIAQELAWQIRHRAMHPEQRQDAVKLPDDEDGIHFGLFDENKLISVVSWFRQNNNQAQFRKLATLEEFRNSGYGTQLLRYIIEFSETEGIEVLWCNARKNVLNFYKKSGFSETETTFRKNGLDYVIIQLELIKSVN